MTRSRATETHLPTVYVVGSFRDLESSRQVARRLGELGFAALLSEPGDPKGIEGCLDRLARCDLVYVSNPRGEIGRSVSLDLGYAFGLGKPVFAARPIEDPPVGRRVAVAAVDELPSRVRAHGAAGHGGERVDGPSLRAVALRWMKLHEAHRRPGFEEEFAALHAADFQDLSPAGRASGGDALKQGLVEWYRAFPDLEVQVDDLVVDEAQGKVAIRWSAQGTHRGAFLGVAATGGRIGFRGIELITVARGALVERWGEWDGLDLLAQLRAASSGGAPG